MGNHGPAYYKRYVKEFEKFVLFVKQINWKLVQKMKLEMLMIMQFYILIIFIKSYKFFLKPYSQNFETSMFYVSDHGESLGENGLYLHGMPYFLVSDAQKHVASVMWFEMVKRKY